MSKIFAFFKCTNCLEQRVVYDNNMKIFMILIFPMVLWFIAIFHVSRFTLYLVKYLVHNKDSVNSC